VKVTLLGHAAVYIEMNGARALMDPVFQDPFEDTAVVSCPKRTIDIAAIPPVDLLVVSHAHLDHFDIPSLARVAHTSRKRCDVMCPEDKVIVYALEKLGFSKIHPEKSLKHFVGDKYELLTTPSYTDNVVEFGVLFKDRSGTFWNQVDSRLLPHAVPGIVKQCGRVDLLFAMYASQNFNFFESRGTGFPYEMHQLNLDNVMAIRPRLAVPGSAGFRFAGPGMEWCNTFLFPMSRERFITDLARLAPEIPTCSANPGDVFEIEPAAVRHLPGASRIAKTLEDDSHLLRFDPTAEVPPLEDPNPVGYSSARMATAVDEALDGFERFVRDAMKTRDDPCLEAYRSLRASYAVGVVFPDGAERWLRVELGEHEATFERTEGQIPVADAGHRIVASSITAWMAHEKTHFYLRAFSRKWQCLYGLEARDGKVAVEKKELRDLFAYYLDRKSKDARVGMKDWLDLQLKPYIRSRD
jgi:L-ascorbate metabolism protein UlaG (beta-lactamase superfamily)